MQVLQDIIRPVRLNDSRIAHSLLKMECKKESNKKKCACTYEPCPRKGVCCECIAYHRGMGELPGCLFTPAAEKTYDRSIKNFMLTQKR